MKYPNLRRWIKKHWPTHSKLKARIDSTFLALTQKEKQKIFEECRKMKEVSPDVDKIDTTYEKIYRRSFFKCIL